jgi:hypothetical protein
MRNKMANDPLHLIADRVRPAEALDPELAGRVQRPLELDVQRARAEAAAVRGTEHPQVADRIEAERAGLAKLLLVQALARHAILAWEGVLKAEGTTWRR